jgi:hypothetical protein
VQLVRGQLPGEDLLGAVLPAVESQPIRAVDGWRWSVDADQEVLLWQEKPDTIGMVVTNGVAPADTVRIAENVETATAPPPDEPAVVGRSNEGGPVEYRVEWAETWPGEDDGPCTRLVVEDEPSGHMCGIDQPDATFLAIGPAATEEGVDVYWGIVGPSVSMVELDLSDDGERVAEALPLDRGDPDSMRYVVITAPHTELGTTTARFLGPDGHVLATETIDFVGSLDG